MLEKLIPQRMTAEEKLIQEMSYALMRENYVKVNQIANREALTSAELFDLIAIAACHIYAARKEPKRSKEWTAIQTLLEMTQYESWADAVDIRAESEL